MAPQRLGNSTCPSRCRSTSFILAGLFLCAIIARHTTVVADEAPAGSKASTSNRAVAGSASPAADAATPTAAAATTSTTQPPPIIITNRPLLGQNGTGLRWTNNTRVPSSSKPMVVSEPIIPAATSKPELSTTKVVGTTSTTGKVAPTISPREVAAPAPAKVDPPSSSPWEDEYLSNVDTDKAELTDEELRAKNLTLGTEQHHVYYNSTTIQSPDVQEYLKTFQNLTPNTLLSKSHRRALTIHLKFEFPFYGHLVENITVATGGFIYTGDYVHSWLAATQFIAPLMANFDTSLSNDSFVKYYDNGTAFTILWENVRLQDLSKKGGFTFSATLHQNGDIVFGYYKIPVSIDSIEDKKHPVKVGLSDAYISDKMVFYTRRKTIFEYHRLNFESTPINSNTMIILKPEPTCNIMQTCSECMALTTFKCGWCPTMNRCSTGTDRKRHDWLLQGCEKSQITTEAECPSHDIPVRVSTVKPNQMPAPGASRVHDSGEVDPEEKGHVGTAMGIFIPFGLVILVVGWIMYAYRNPHTKSGQLLIQYRPSQWSWRRGEARYTAATIHM